MKLVTEKDPTVVDSYVVTSTPDVETINSFFLPEPATEPASTMYIREPFRFVFRGYSIWLELSQTDHDLDNAVAKAAMDNGLFPIPEPHCTVIYGVTHMTEAEARRSFLEKVVPAVEQWPALETKGSHCGFCFDGVDGEEMDMAWAEITLASSPEHENLVDKVHDCFYGVDNCDPAEDKERVGPWKPHVSLAYDNPEGSALDDLSADKIFATHPTLLGRKKRDVLAISLWSTEGTINQWKKLERYTFQ